MSMLWLHAWAERLATESVLSIDQAQHLVHVAAAAGMSEEGLSFLVSYASQIPRDSAAIFTQTYMALASGQDEWEAMRR